MNPLYMGNMANVVGLSIEDGIPRQMIYGMLPALESLYNQVTGILAVWESPRNDVNAKIVAAKAGETDFGGYDPDDMARLGNFLLKFKAFMETEYEITLADEVTTETTTPLTLMLTRYVPMGA